MLTSESLSKIAPALAKAQAEFRAVGKSGDNTFDRYYYSTLEDYMNTIRPILNQYGLTLLASVTETIALEDRPTAAGKCEHAVRVKISMRILHESGEWIEAESWGEGQDRADKAVYKAITGARKYGIASLFGLVTTDDPEATIRVQDNQKPVVQTKPMVQAKPLQPRRITPQPVQRPSTPFPPATAADEILSDEAYLMKLSIAFKDRHFGDRHMHNAVNEFCRQKGADKLENLSHPERTELLNKVTSGRLDRFKTSNGAQQHAVA